MTKSTAESFELDRVSVRLADTDDHGEVLALFHASLDEGMVRANDTGADIERLQEAYFSDDGQSGLWVAIHEDQVVGMIGVQKTSENEAEIRRLRVHKDLRRRGVGTLLMHQALGFCKRHVYLKIILDVRIEQEPAIALFKKFGFSLSRTRDIDGRKMLDFYFDLYRESSG